MSASRGGNVSALAVIRATQMLTGLGVQLVVARMGLEALGTYGWLIAVSTLASTAVGLGLPLWLSREVAHEPKRAAALLSPSLRLIGLLGTLAMLLLPPLLVWRAPGPDAWLLAGLATASMVGMQTARALGGVFSGLREAKLELPGVVAGRLLTLAGALTAWMLDLGLVGVFVGALAGAWLDAGLGFVLARRRLGALVHTVPLRPVARASAPYGINLFAGIFYLSADILVLKELRDDAEVGAYQLAAVIALQLPALAQVVAHAALPKMTDHVRTDTSLLSLVTILLRPLLGVAWVLAIGGVVVAVPLVIWVGGSPESIAAAGPLALLLPLVPVRFANAVLGTVITAANLQPYRTRAAVAAAGGNLLANLMLVPWLGATGAALTTLLTELALGVWFANLTGHLVGPYPLFRLHLRGLLAGAAMALVVTWCAPFGLLTQLFAGLVAGSGALVMTGSLRRSDLAALRAL